MAQPDRYTTSPERLKKDRELIVAASLSSLVFGALLALLMIAAMWLADTSEADEPDLRMDAVRAGLLIAAILVIGLGLGVWYHQRWCAVATLVLLIGLMATHILVARGAVGSVFLLIVPLVPAIANWIALPAFRRLAASPPADS